MPGRFLYDVFLCYRDKDREVVREIADRLRGAGLKVWFGDGDVGSALANSRNMVFCMSAAAFGADWPVLEARTFGFREPAQSDRRFVPLRVDGMQPISWLANSEHLDWRTRDHDKLIESCGPREPKQGPDASARTISLGHTAAVGSWPSALDGMYALSGSDDKRTGSAAARMKRASITGWRVLPAMPILGRRDRFTHELIQ